MDTGELLPGLFKVMEERLGEKRGRWVTSGFIVIIVLGIGAFMVSLFVEKAVLPVMQLVSDMLGRDYEANLMNLLVVSVAGGVVAVVGLLGFWLIERQSRKQFRADFDARVRVELLRILEDQDVIIKKPVEWDELGHS